MYLTFYGLKERPFNATPDPKFLFLTPGHREALAQLIFSVRENRGFLVLTGEIGTGKTTLLQALLQRLNGKTAVAYVFNSALPFEGLLEYMLEELQVPTRGESLAQRLLDLRRFMLDRNRAGQNTALILDEAQNLDAATLEQIRLLSNFETPTEKLLQILLVGQPELRAKLNRPELRQLRQRIELQCSIPTLSSEQVGDYIQRRLHVAGAQDPGLFSDRARARIAAYSRGIPRSVNLLCDHCLILGYADQRRRIEVDIVDQALEALEGPHLRGAGSAAAASERGEGNQALVRVQHDETFAEGALAQSSVAAPFEHHSRARWSTHGSLRRRVVAGGLAVVALAGLIVVASGYVARLKVQQPAAPPRAAVAPSRQPERPQVSAVPSPQSELAKASVVVPHEAERPQVSAVPPPQSELAKVPVVAPRQPERPTVTDVPPRQPASSQAPVIAPRTPLVKTKSVTGPVPRNASESEEPNPPQGRAESVERPAQLAGTPSDKDSLQRFLRSLSSSDLGGKE